MKYMLQLIAIILIHVVAIVGCIAIISQLLVR